MESTSYIRPAAEADLGRIAEIEVFNYRLNFYPIFRDDEFYFRDLQVSTRSASLGRFLDELWVYDDGAVKGFIRVHGDELCKLFVEPVLQSQGIGAALLAHAVDALGIRHLLGVGEECPRHRLLPAARLSPDRSAQAGGGHDGVPRPDGTVNYERPRIMQAMRGLFICFIPLRSANP